jgi:hypothetical protein
MLIDSSYFLGPLTIAQLGQESVVDDLNNFIDRFEPVIMEAALGYDFYQAFLEGLNVSSDEEIEPRWLDLLNGVTFTNLSQSKRKFSGFAGGDNTLTVLAAQRNDLTIYAGITPGFAVDGNSYVSPSLNGWNFELELFGAGTLERGVDWNYKSGGGIVLTDADYKTQYNERWVLHFTGKKVQDIQSGNQNLLSPLANFIYYEYMVNLHKQATGSGIKKSDSENSSNASPNDKLANAYNEGVRQIQLFWEFMWVDSLKQTPVYPEFNYRQLYGYNYGSGYFDNPWSDQLYDFSYINPLF